MIQLLAANWNFWWRDIRTDLLQGSDSFLRTNISLGCQEISHILHNPKVNYRVYSSLPFVPVLSQINVVHTFTFSLFKIHSNNVFPSMPRLSKWSLSFRFSYKNSACISVLLHKCHMPHLPHHPWFNCPNNI